MKKHFPAALAKIFKMQFFPSLKSVLYACECVAHMGVELEGLNVTVLSKGACLAERLSEGLLQNDVIFCSAVSKGQHCV